jgi:hypothetical protein
MGLSLEKPFSDFFDRSEAQLRDGKRQFTAKEAAVIETWFQRWCKANGMDNMKAPPWAKLLYLSGVVSGITYAGQELRGKNRERPFHGEGG